MSLAAATEDNLKAQEELAKARSEEGEQIRKLNKETAKLRKEQEKYEKSMRQTVREMSFADLGKQLRNDIFAPITGFLNRAPNFVKTLGMMFIKPFVGGVKKSTETIADGPAATTETVMGIAKERIGGELLDKAGEKLGFGDFLRSEEVEKLEEIKEILEYSKNTLDEMLRLHMETWQTSEDIHEEALKENKDRKKSKVDSSKKTEDTLETDDDEATDGSAPKSKGIFGPLAKAFKAIKNIVKKFLKWKTMLILLFGSLLAGLALEYWEPIKKKVGEIKDWLVNTLFPAISEFVDDVVMPLAIKIKDWVANIAFPAVFDLFMNQLESMKELARSIVERFEGFSEMSFKDQLFAVLGAIEDFGKYIVDTVRNFGVFILDLFGLDGEALAKEWFDPLRDAVYGIIDWFKLVFTDPGEALSQLWNGLFGETGIVAWIWDEGIKPIFSWIGQQFVNMGNAIAEKWNEWFPDGILSWIWDNTLGAVFSWIGKKLGNMADAISTKWNETFPDGILGWIWNPIQESMNSIGDFFASIFDIDWAGLLSKFLPDKVAKWLMGESDPFDKAVESGLYTEKWYGKSTIDRSKVKDAPTAQLQAILDDDDLSKEDKQFVESQIAQRKAGAGAAGIAPRDESATDIDAAVAERKRKSRSARAMRGMGAADETSIGGAPIEKLREMGHDDLADRAVPDENGNLWLHGQDAKEAARILAPQYEREATTQGQIIQSNVSSEPGSQGPHSSVVAPPPTTAQAANALYNRPAGTPRGFDVTDASTNVTSSSSNSNTNYTIVNRMPARAYDPHTTAQYRRFRGRGGS